jgi:hypothetical protein
MNIEQIKRDYDNGVLISRATLGQLIEFALVKPQPAPMVADALHPAYKRPAAGEPNRAEYQSQAAYDRAYDAWAQRRA